MNIQTRLDFGWEWYSTGAPSALDEQGRCLCSSIEHCRSILTDYLDAPSVLLEPIYVFDRDDLEEIEFFEVSCRAAVSLTSGAWDRNFELLYKGAPSDHGGRAPVATVEKLVFTTKRPCNWDLRHLLEGFPELVVSRRFLAEIQEIDENVFGRDLYSGRQWKEANQDFALLATSNHAPPAIDTPSVGHFKGRSRNDSIDGYPHSQYVDLGVPVLPRGEVQTGSALLRSAEPWSVGLLPGWIATHRAARQLAARTKDVVLHPLLKEGSSQHAQHKQYWMEAHALAKEFANVQFSGSGVSKRRFDARTLLANIERGRKSRSESSSV